MRKLAFLTLPVLIILAGLLAASVHAQSDWQAVLYERGTNQVFFIGDNSVARTVTLDTSPPEDYAIQLMYSPQQDIIIRQERRIAAYRGADGTQIFSNDLGGEIDDYRLGSFNPEETAFSVATYRAGSSGMIHIIDPTTGATLQSAAVRELAGEDVAVLGGWTAEGILFLPTCACEPPLVAHYHLWNPETNEVTLTAIPYQLTANRVATLTNDEFITGRNDPAYPSNRGTHGPPSNVVVWSPSGASEDAFPIYFAYRLWVPSLFWTANGQQALLNYPDSTIILERDGTSWEIPRDVSPAQIIGTSDGWLEWHHTDGMLRHHMPIPGQAQTTSQDIATIPGDVQVVYAPPLGADDLSDLLPFPPAEGFTPFTCNGMQSRLLQNMEARVTPGPPNNLRAGPGRDANIIAEIPGATYLMTISPAQCVDGLIWWQVDVNYGESIGWTAEGSNGSYWLEPLFMANE